MEPARLRPLQIGEILDTAIKIYTSRFSTLIKAVAVVVIPVQVLAALITLSLPSPEEITTVNSLGEDVVDGGALMGFIAALVAVGVMSWLATLIATGACLKIVSDSYLGEDTDWRVSLRFATSRFWPLVWVSILTAVLTGLGFVACIIPGVYFGVAWSVAVPALLMEDYRGFKAMSRSRRLVEGFWWRAFGCLVLAMILGAIISRILTAILEGIVLTSDSDLIGVLAAGLATVISSTFITPGTAAVTAVLYFDFRVRKEGFDLELLARSMGVAPPPAAAAPSPWDQQPPVGPPAAPGSGGDQPPFWPPPPGWRPPGG